MIQNNTAQTGSLLITSKQSTIKKIDATKNSTIYALSKVHLGGWLAVSNLLPKDNVQFVGSASQIITSVLNNPNSIGVIPTGVIESLEIQKDSIRFLDLKKYLFFPHLTSSKLYPGWVLAKTSNKNIALAKEMSKHLLHASTLTPQWTAPYDYKSVHELLKNTASKAYTYDNEQGFQAWILNNKRLTLVLFLLVSLSFFFILYVIRTQEKLRIEIARKDEALERINHIELDPKNRQHAKIKKE
jgi:polar amino acid transport system substrate-binding protein